MALDPPLCCQDTQYSISSGSTQAHALRSTYDSPLSFPRQLACPTSRRISLQQLQKRAKMYSKEQSTMERSRSSASRASFGAHKRSVPGMKTLMPLKLLSPTLPEFDTWPSLEPSKRTTFGTRIASQDFEEFSEIGDRARDSMISRKRSQQYRDTPIYSEPGSPIPSRAYFSDDDVCFNFSQPGSISDEEGIIQDFVSLPEDEMEADNHSQDDGEQTPYTVKDFPQGGLVTPTPRWSELSFQCSGEALFENEAAWLRSPMSKNSSANDTMLAVDARDDNLAERIVESWLSDTGSSFEHEDEVLSCATALSPSKAQVIDLRINPNHPSELSLRIPARSSSLMGTCVPENNFWETLGTPPITPAGPWGRDPDMVHRAHSPDYDNNMQLPKRRLDLAMPSPPLSPHASPQKRRTRRLSTQEFDNQWPLTPPSLPQPLLIDIVSSLEALTSSFPSTILLSESPCITAIRSRNASPSPILRQNTTSPPPLRSPFGHEFPRPPSYQPTGKPNKRASFHRRDFSTHTASDQPTYHPSSIQSSSLPFPPSPTSFHLPDLSPLERIFPNTSDIMLSSLYGHILAHIFITSLSLSLSPLPSPEYAHPPTNRKARRDTPHWTASPLSPKAANILGMPVLDEDSVEKQLQFKLRIQALQQNLRKCIYCLISVMDESLGIEDMAEFDDSGPGFNNGKLFMRTLEEVVRGCEARNGGAVH